MNRRSIVISATLYTLSFIVRPLWWTILLFTLPLVHIRFNFLNGFLWGLCAFSLHASGILYATMRMQNGPWILRIIPSIIIVLYLSLHAGIWFFMVGKIKTLNLSGFLYVCVVSLLHTFFFWYTSYYCFWPLAGIYGYSFINPLLPLTQSPACLVLIRYTGMIGSLFVLFLFSTLITFFSKKFLIIFCTIGLIYLYLPLSITEPLPDWVKLIAPFQIQFSSTTNSIVPLEYLKSFIHAHPHKKIFITPESAFYCYDIFNKSPITALAIPHVTCILGSFTHTQAKRYNSLYYIKNGTIRDTHHKQHALAFTESVPAWCTIGWIEQLYDKKTFIIPAPKKHDLWVIDNHIIEPYICSEFFCHPLPLHPLQKESTLLVCCNDSWFTGWSRYAAHLMVADAQLKGVAWNTEIIYIGYQDALFITKRGYISTL